MAKTVKHLFLFLALGLLLAACGDGENAGNNPPAPTAPSSTASGGTTVDNTTALPAAEATPAPPTAIPPTPTPTEPLAALVNGEPILLATFELELARYAQGQIDLGLSEPEAVYRGIVLNNLVDQTLIRQAAQAQNITITADQVNARIAQLTETAGGTDNFQAWLAANQLSEADFNAALAQEMLGEQVMAIVTSSVPQTAEQIRARYLQVKDTALAQSILSDIQAGGDFAALAQQHSLDRMTGENGGDLDYFTPGTLLVPEVEAAAFALEVGQTSGIIAIPSADGSETTYYIVQVTDRRTDQPLTPAQRANLMRQTFESWLAEQRSQAEIVQFIDAGG